MNSKKLQLSTRKLKYGNVCKGIKKMLIQKRELELKTRIQACTDPYRSHHRKYHLRYLVAEWSRSKLERSCRWHLKRLPKSSVVPPFLVGAR